MEWPTLLAKAVRRSEVIVGGSLLGVALLGLLDHWTGADLSFVLFYLLPILFASWYGGEAKGRVIALASVAAWWTADWPGEGLKGAILWNVAEKLAFFLLFAHVVSALKRSLAHEYERELEIGREVQQRLFPASVPAVPGLDVAVRLIPNRALSGDYYDFFPTETGLGVVVADVMGKGVSASLLTASVHAVLHAVHHPRREDGLARMLSQVNEHLFRSTDSGRFVTLAYAALDPAFDRLECAVAGHPPPLLWNPGGDPGLRELGSTGPVLGVLPRAHWEVHQATFPPGSLLVLYTDGVLEATSLGEEELGLERLRRSVERYAVAGAGAQEVVDGLLAELLAWTGGTAFADDVAVLAIRREPLVPSREQPPAHEPTRAEPRGARPPAAV